MTSLNDGAPSRPLPSVAPGPSSSKLPSRRFPVDEQSLASSTSSLPYRRSNASVSSLFAATSAPAGSRPMSPVGGGSSPSSQQMTGSVFISSPSDISPFADASHDPRYLLSQSYVPHIAVHSSLDTEELVRDKGFRQGLWELLRPFGDRIQGKVTVRDSIGASRTYDDFGVRFVQLGDGLTSARSKPSASSGGDEVDRYPDHFQGSRTGGNIDQIETVVGKHLSYAEEFQEFHRSGYFNPQDSLATAATSPFYSLYLRRLLSGLPLVPHETFSHPVACIMAISSRNPQPLEALRSLYDDTSRGEKRLPVWVHAEYLRYYVLVHDEERDDISKSMALFEQMKRHFGLHCHLLRIRSTQCVPTDDDSIELPRSEWLSAAEELAIIQGKEIAEDIDELSPCIFESDATAIKTFIREMVTQSIIPSMERCVSTWNDQVASRRRGLSGRFISMSKKWSVFGGRSSSVSGTTGTSGSSSNYDLAQGFYRPETPEAIMRKLADYAFMLRDWKLAQSTYDLLRSDFSNDKAWKYHAAANEMAAVSTLLLPHSSSARIRTDTIDQLLEAASYSYLTRCGSFYGTLRSLTLGLELLKIRGGSATDAAARWGSRILETNVVGAIGDALVKERVAVCYASRKGSGTGGWGSRIRKSAMWKILAADAWFHLEKHVQVERCLAEANSLYSQLPSSKGLSGFTAAQAFVARLEHELQAGAFATEESQLPGGPLDDAPVEEESENLDTTNHRRSLIGATVPPLNGLQTAPLSNQAIAEDLPREQSGEFSEA